MTRLQYPYVILLGVLLGITTTREGYAQTEPSAQKAPAGDDQLRTAPRSESDVQQLIEALYISRLQEELRLTDEQYAATIPAVKNYLRVRQAGARQKRLVERQLNQMLDSGASDDQVQGKLKELDELKKQNEQNLQSAMSEIDSKLDIRQRVRFRLYQQRTDQRINHMIQQIREGRRMQRMQGGPPPNAMQATPQKRMATPEGKKR
ncbi:MAG: hypothetical protein LAO31_09720 [Acidobacteriia bacterium]|nr:hypothetical protein [Terriglobia bacterium]